MEEDITAALYHAVDNNDLIKLRHLLQDGANPNERYTGTPYVSFTILHLSCEKGNLHTTRALVEAGADVLSRDTWGMSPLIHSIICQQEDVVEYLISECPSSLNFPDKSDSKDALDYRTALQISLTKRHLDVVPLLLRAGADVNTEDKGGHTPLTNLISSSVRPSCDVIGDDVIEVMTLLIQMGANLNSNKCENSNPLLVSTLLKSAKFVEYFLACGADPNIEFSSGITPLIAATGNRDQNTVRLLLEHNAKVDPPALVSYGRRERRLYDPFELAVDLLQWDIVDLLVQYGYNLSQHDYMLSMTPSDRTPVALLNNPDTHDRLRRIACSPPSLEKIVILNVRKILGLNLLQKVQKLVLPYDVRNKLVNL
ncbi:ankyrin repeat and SOCS box protein 9-like isoform X2 [Saccostrea echinata]|uniref:ankyrin repeat and SOCS box protein 9-like isoform X2 n=1 Tax=Saccostrea echinata TaxID=191078 RepID=UPI002A834F99|nr:ankyrin repeat and SOCS box protein 9-like isoform X2 [Saccostrea echinata]